MKTKKYRLIKHKTNDGLMEVYSDIPLGKMYDVIIDSEETATFYNTEKRIFHKKNIIWIYDKQKDEKVCFPTECLENHSI